MLAPIARAALTFALIALPALAQADNCPDDVLPSPEVTEELIRWIGAETGYDITPALLNPPSLAFCSQGQHISYEGRSITVEQGLNAAYDLPARRIFLVSPWHPGNTRDISVLLHELAHVVQFDSRTWACPGAAEWQAYRLQHKWLAEQGIASGFNWAQIRLSSLCSDGVHP